MGRRNDNELTPGAEEAADATLRALLARHNEPKHIPPPPALAARITRQVPKMPPIAARRAAQGRALRRRVAAWASVCAVLLLSLVGAWGILGNSNDPARLFGGPETTLGYVTLLLTLMAKPVVASVGALGAPTLLGGVLAACVVAWAWWRLAAQSPVPVVEQP